MLNNQFFSILFLIAFFYSNVTFSQRFSMNGQWQTGENRIYTDTVNVPHIGNNPKQMNNGKLWYKRRFTLPKGDWKYATLTLNGARFLPIVYINGDSVSASEGGMAPVAFILRHKAVKPQATVTIEIALSSLKDVPFTDASRIPKADWWRSNVSSSIWDDVYMEFHDEYYLQSVKPFFNLEKDEVHFHTLTKSLQSKANAPTDILYEIFDKESN
jgi:hypothetical protein